MTRWELGIYLLGWIGDRANDVKNFYVNTYTDISNNVQSWDWQTIGGVAIIVSAIALSIATAGLATPIAAAVGGGLFGAIVGGAIAGTIGGAIVGFGMSIGTQAIANGFNNIDWNQVGLSTLSGAISGFVVGGAFGSIQYFASASKIANSVSGFNKAQANLNNVISTMEKGRASLRAFGQAVASYNSAYASFITAKVTSSITSFIIEYLIYEMGQNYFENEFEKGLYK